MEMSIRPRRLRKGELLRKMVRETRVDESSLIYPMFVKEGTNQKEEIPTMPGQYRYTVDRVSEQLDALLDAGVTSVMLFGIPGTFLLFAGLAAAIAGLCRVFGSSANEYVEIYGDEDEEDVF